MNFEFKPILANKPIQRSEACLTALLADSGIASIFSVDPLVNGLPGLGEDSPDAMAELLAADPAVCSQLIEIANASFAERGGMVSEVLPAIHLLGVYAARNLIPAIKCFEHFFHAEKHQTCAASLWEHSLEVADVAKLIAFYETKDDRIAEDAYLGGLYHDIGKLLLLDAAPNRFVASRDQAETEKCCDWKVEEALIGCDHAEAGAFLLRQWEMPPSLIQTVGLHHQPQRAAVPRFSALAAVHAANALVWVRRIDCQNVWERLDEAFIESIGCTDSIMDWIEWVLGDERGADCAHRNSAASTESPPERPREKVVPAPIDPLRGNGWNGVFFPPASGPKLLNSFGFLSLHAAGLIVACLLVVAFGVWLTLRPSPADSVSASGGNAFAHSELQPVDQSTALRTPGEGSISVDAPSSSSFSLANPTGSTGPGGAAASASKERSIGTGRPGIEPARTQAISTYTVARLEAPYITPATSEADLNADGPVLVLSGIYYRPSNSVAVINGIQYPVGASVSGALITRITRESVEVSYDGQTLVLELK